jgi:hypothetical protein
MGGKKKPVREDRVNLGDEDQDEENAHLYGMGRGLFGNPEGEKDIEQSQIGSVTKDTPGLMTEPPPTGEGPLKDIEGKIKARPRASDAPGAIIPYHRRDEAILDILGQYGDKLYEAPLPVLHLCANLLAEIEDEGRFNAIRNHFESHGIKNMPTWENRQQIDELYAGFLGLGGGNRNGSPYPSDRANMFNPGSQKRVDKGFTFHVPKPPSKNRSRAGAENARKVGGTSGGMHARMANARRVLDATKKNSRREAGRKNGDRMRGSRGRDFRKSGSSRNPWMRLAAGKYTDISNGKVVLREGYPTIENGMPWFHGTVRRDTVGGVPAILVDESHVICSGSLPRPKFTEGKKVWDCECPLGSYAMEIAFAQVTEGMESVRPWLKKDDKGTKVLGFPTEGVIVRATPGKKSGPAKRKSDQLEFMTFDSEAGFQALQEWLIYSMQDKGSYRAIEEAITYGYVRAGASDLILDRVIRKLNRLNILDVFEDAVFDTGSEALYVLLNPQLEESEVQEIALGLQTEYPEVQILGGPLDEDVDWWVLYMPKEGMDFGPQLDRILEPSIARPFDVDMPDVVGQAIQQVTAQV